MHPLAARRILRLALGTGLSMWVSQAVAWDLSFIAPVMTLFILALPLPALSLKMGIKFLAADVYFISDLPSELRFGDVAIIGSIALILSLASTVYPSWLGSRTAPAEALRYD